MSEKSIEIYEKGHLIYFKNTLDVEESISILKKNIHFITRDSESSVRVVFLDELNKRQVINLDWNNVSIPVVSGTTELMESLNDMFSCCGTSGFFFEDDVEFDQMNAFVNNSILEELRIVSKYLRKIYNPE